MDVGTTRLVIIILGLLCFICLGGAITLAILGVDTPQILVATIASSSGAIVGILVKTPNGPDRNSPGS